VDCSNAWNSWKLQDTRVRMMRALPCNKVHEEAFGSICEPNWHVSFDTTNHDK
jgi:hypothetical protein